MITSRIHQFGRVTFPDFIGERVHMREFTREAGLPADLRRWQDTVDAMLDGVEADGPIYLMIDQAPVLASSTHRRPGLHVDGYWHPAQSDSAAGRHTGVHTGSHRHVHFGSSAEGLILASNVLGCAAYVGAYEGVPGEGGDCDHVDTGGLMKVDLEPGRVWAGHTLNMLHESLPVARDCMRTVFRLNVPGWIPA